MSNVVLALKARGDQRMWIDFIDVNRTTPKDYFPLPSIDQLVDATDGFGLMSIMDIYLGYHESRMHS